MFAQNANKNSGSAASNATDDSSTTKSIRVPYQKKPTNVRCCKCIKLGHTSVVCPNSKPPEQVHGISADIDDASVACDASSVIILAQQGGRGAIDPNYLLLDSQSTINLFSNPNHVDNVRPATQPIKVHCNKGVMPTDNIADFGHNVVYINPNRTAYVLSLYLLGQRHHITYNSKDNGGVFKVHTSKGVLEFTLTPSGLHVLDLKQNPHAAHVLITATTLPDDQHLHVNTVRENFKGFTKKQIQWAQEACRLMLMMAVPSECAFQSMVRLNQLKNCPLTHNKVKNALTIYGHDLANTRGKTVWCQPDHVVTDYVEIPVDILSFNRNVTHVGDVMFVNSIPFLVLVSRNINLIAIEHAPKRTASKLGHLFQQTVNVYT
jgi:hypothetical protein